MADEAAHRPLLPDIPIRGLPSDIQEDSVFRSLFIAYPDALLLVDGSGRIMLANPAAAALLGYRMDELVGLNVDVLVPDAIRPRHAAYRETYSHAPRARPMGTQMELVAKRQDGTEVMVEIALSPLQNHGLPFVVAAIRDIGAYPRVRQALQRARYSEHLAQVGRLAVDTRNVQQLLAHVPEIVSTALQVEVAVVWLLDTAHAEFRMASGVGLVGAEKVGMCIANRADTPPGFVYAQSRPVLIPDYAEEHRFAIPESYLDAGLVSALAVPLLDRGRVTGVLAVRSRASKRFGDEEVQFLEALCNLLATTLQRAQTEEALNHAQRLESVGQLTGGIAHDFNNLLTVIQGNLQVLEELPALTHDVHVQQLLGAATRASRRAAELTAKLLTFSRRQVLQPIAVDTHALLHSLADMLRRTLDQRIRIEIDIAADRRPVLADPGQLESALLNIAINARDAMPEGGTLRFHTAVCETLPEAVRIGGPGSSVDAEAPYVAISVTDDGIGMPDGVRERVFEPFFTTKEAGRGTGLGLSTVYGFVSQSNGGVAIDSALGQGTTVTLYLPLLDEAQLPGSDEDVHGDETSLRGLHVLLVEDDAEVRAVVTTFLVMLGCEVTAACTAEEALSVMDAGTAVFDMLVSDIALGAGMRGIRLAVEAQRRHPSLAVLLISGFSSELLDADREVPQSWGLLRKPCSRAELARAMTALVSGHA